MTPLSTKTWEEVGEETKKYEWDEGKDGGGKMNVTRGGAELL